MFGILLTILVMLFVLSLIYWIGTLLLGAFGAPPIALKIWMAICAVILLIWVLNIAGVVGPSWRIRL